MTKVIASSVVVGVLALFSTGVHWYFNLPIMQKTADGKCVRAVTFTKDGEVKLPCDAVKGKQYLVEYVAR